MPDIKRLAHAEVMISATTAQVWQALVTPGEIGKYMFGTKVASDWKVGSPITWQGEWKGKTYEDKGKILAFDVEKRLAYSHFSALSGKQDMPENYHTVSITLTPQEGSTKVELTQDNVADTKEQEHSAANWQTMLDGLKKLLEGSNFGEPKA